MYPQKYGSMAKQLLKSIRIRPLLPPTLTKRVSCPLYSTLSSDALQLSSTITSSSSPLPFPSSDLPIVESIPKGVTAEKFAAVLQSLNVLPSDKAVVAVSGGSDSMALAMLSSEYFEKGNLSTITIDHKLRSESTTEARHVSSLLQAKQVPHTIVGLDWTGKEKPTVSNLQETAREERYQALMNFVLSQNAKFVFVAHHAEDQAETFLMRLAHVSALDGLSGMAQSTPVPLNNDKAPVNIIRPLLPFSKQELRDTCTRFDMQWVEDPSNQNLAFQRVRIRQALTGLAQWAPLLPSSEATKQIDDVSPLSAPLPTPLPLPPSFQASHDISRVSLFISSLRSWTESHASQFLSAYATPVPEHGAYVTVDADFFRQLMASENSRHNLAPVSRRVLSRIFSYVCNTHPSSKGSKSVDPMHQLLSMIESGALKQKPFHTAGCSVYEIKSDKYFGFFSPELKQQQYKDKQNNIKVEEIPAKSRLLFCAQSRRENCSSSFVHWNPVFISSASPPSIIWDNRFELSCAATYNARKKNATGAYIIRPMTHEVESNFGSKALQSTNDEIKAKRILRRIPLAVRTTLPAVFDANNGQLVSIPHLKWFRRRSAAIDKDNEQIWAIRAMPVKRL